MDEPEKIAVRNFKKGANFHGSPLRFTIIDSVDLIRQVNSCNNFFAIARKLLQKPPDLEPKVCNKILAIPVNPPDGGHGTGATILLLLFCMSKVTAVAPANIAFIKYWGKQDERLNIPFTSSISMNLGRCFTKTAVEFDEKLKEDIVRIDNKVATDKEKARVSKFLDEVRKLAKITTRAEVDSKNSFPKGTGIVSSASGFAALALAASRANFC
ncbi:MAG: hypothetical protein FJ044_00565 [Candidatus Cloacimonetes bacterium]|nr:hypothetical protein [Candidatus Cloacimonadota bacterium]